MFLNMFNCSFFLILVHYVSIGYAISFKYDVIHVVNNPMVSYYLNTENSQRTLSTTRKLKENYTKLFNNVGDYLRLR